MSKTKENVYKERSKYTEQELKDMASITLEALDSNDPRGEAVLIMTSFFTGLSPQAVLKKIKELNNE